MNKVSFYPFSDKTEVFVPKPEPSIKSMPDWYKQQPGFIGDEFKEYISKGGMSSTIKRCMPIFDLITAGYIFKVPMDIYINATNPEKITWSVPNELKFLGNDMIATHTSEQVSNYPVNLERYHKQIFRILPFWAMMTPKGYSTLFTHPFHRDPVPFQMFEAIVDTDKFASDGHLSMHIEKGFEGIIKQGTPLIQAIPFKRESWESEFVAHSEGKGEIERQRLLVRSSFRNSYKEKFRQKKEYK